MVWAAPTDEITFSGVSNRDLGRRWWGRGPICLERSPTVVALDVLIRREGAYP